MNNLPLKALPWNAMHTDDKRIFVEHAQGAGVFYTVYGAIDSDFGTRWHDQMEGSHGKKEGFELIEDVKNWIATDHYPSKMQPYVKPMPTWIDVNEREPTEKGDYLIRDYQGRVAMGKYDKEGFYMESGGDKWGMVSQWMPIPEFSTMQNMHKGECCE